MSRSAGLRPTKVPRDALQLIAEEVTPAVSPLLLERSNIRLNEPKDLFQLPLLELDDAMPTSAASAWTRWFEFAGVRAAPPAPRLLFTFVDQSVQAAVRGQGVVLGRSPFPRSGGSVQMRPINSARPEFACLSRPRPL